MLMHPSVLSTDHLIIMEGVEFSEKGHFPSDFNRTKFFFFRKTPHNHFPVTKKFLLKIISQTFKKSCCLVKTLPHSLINNWLLPYTILHEQKN